MNKEESRYMMESAEKGAMTVVDDGIAELEAMIARVRAAQEKFATY